MKVSGIYSIINTINGKIYIGSSNNINRRLSSHRNLLINNNHFNKHLQSSFNIYGLKSFTFNIIEISEEDRLVEMEEHYIQFYKSNILGYNMRIKCDTNRGKKFSKSHIENLRKSHMGHKRSEESNDKIRKSQFKSVYKIDDIGNIVNKYESIISASKENNIYKSAISACCIGNLNSTGGYFWCFVLNYRKEDFINRKIGNSKKNTYI